MVRLLPRIAAAASVAVLILALSWIYFSKNDNSSKLASEYYEIASSPSGNRSSNSALPMDEQMKLGRYEFFVMENFKSAIAIFSSIPEDEKLYSDAQYYLAHCYLRSENFALAAEKFRFLLSLETLPIYINKQELTWNLLLSYLGNGQMDEFNQTAAALSELPNLNGRLKRGLEEIKK